MEQFTLEPIAERIPEGYNILFLRMVKLYYRGRNVAGKLFLVYYKDQSIDCRFNAFAIGDKFVYFSGITLVDSNDQRNIDYDRLIANEEYSNEEYIKELKKYDLLNIFLEYDILSYKRTKEIIKTKYPDLTDIINNISIEDLASYLYRTYNFMACDDHVKMHSIDIDYYNNFSILNRSGLDVYYIMDCYSYNIHKGVLAIDNSGDFPVLVIYDVLSKHYIQKYKIGDIPNYFNFFINIDSAIDERKARIDEYNKIAHNAFKIFENIDYSDIISDIAYKDISFVRDYLYDYLDRLSIDTNFLRYINDEQIINHFLDVYKTLIMEVDN